MDEITPQSWRMTGYYPEEYAKSSAALDGGLDYDEDRFAEYEAKFLADLAAHDLAVAANAWDEGYNVGGHAASGDYSGIYGGNGQEPRNPYRITEENN